MIIESLFDGMSCAYIAAERAGLNITKYYASEVDKYATKVSENNYPNIIRLGDVTKWREWEHEKVDLLTAGSPCQGFSAAGKRGGTKAFLDGEQIIVSSLEQYEFMKELGAEFLSQSHLFWEFIGRLRYLKSIGQAKYFMLENVKMSKENNDMITEALGVEPIEINSALVSAQNRKRLYWTNIPGVDQPSDKFLKINSVLDNGLAAAARRGRYLVDEKKIGEDKSLKVITKQYIEFRHDGKSNCLTTVSKDNVVVNELRNERVLDSEIEYRYLSRVECERLQTVPEGYTNCVSESQAKKMLGNGWTVDVIAHIFKGLKGD